jgi:hypothetical protein
MSDGTVRCWGADDHGQAGSPATAMCGTGPCLAAPTTVPGISAATFVVVSAELNKNSAAFVILSDGSMRGWGDNSAGILGDGTTMGSTTPVSPAW